MKKQGKVRTIPVEDVFEGMQVICQGLIFQIKKIFDKERPVIYGKNNRGNVVHREMHISELKTLVIQYQETMLGLEHRVTYESQSVLQFPLKYSQWQAAIDNGEVDGDKFVNFETLSHTKRDEMGYNQLTVIAKIIPQRKKETQIDPIEFAKWLIHSRRKRFSHSDNVNAHYFASNLMVELCKNDPFEPKNALLAEYLEYKNSGE